MGRAYLKNTHCYVYGQRLGKSEKLEQKIWHGVASGLDHKSPLTSDHVRLSW